METRCSPHESERNKTDCKIMENLRLPNKWMRSSACVRIQQLDDYTGEFGMLAVDEKHQGNGIGRALIQFAEEKCKSENLQKMQLELLVPQEGSHPFKTILEKWYTRIGYDPVHTETVESLFPDLAPQLAIPCQFIIFQKEL